MSEFRAPFHSGPINVDPLLRFRINRISRLNRFYDPDDGDWAWADIQEEGNEIMVFPIPKRPQTWVVSMFSVGKELGLGLLEEKIQVINNFFLSKKSDGRYS